MMASVVACAETSSLAERLAASALSCAATTSTTIGYVIVLMASLTASAEASATTG
jgi:hypothetical protein